MHRLASYTEYVDGNMTAAELERYDCRLPRGYWRTHGGNNSKFFGPCCIRKNTTARLA